MTVQSAGTVGVGHGGTAGGPHHLLSRWIHSPSNFEESWSSKPSGPLEGRRLSAWLSI